MKISIRTIAAGKRRKHRAPEAPPAPAVPSNAQDGHAAICTALGLYFGELHDKERYTLTIKRVSRNYSPWSSKLYGTYDALKRR